MLDNLLNPAVLFFLLGMLATLLRVDLEIPQPIPRVLSLYLLFAIGFHGGVELAANGIGAGMISVLAVSVVAAALIPVSSYFLLRLRLDVPNAAAVAAAYGSISAVTFITATAYLDAIGVSYSGYMVAAMALMESPAIVVAVLLARRYGRTGETSTGMGHVAREAFLNGAVFLLLGSLLIGIVTGKKGWEALAPFVDAPFKGILALFLLDMGLIAARRLGDLRRAGAFLSVFAVAAPVAHAVVAILLARALGLNEGDALLLAILFGSASYIAVPAAIRVAIPEANPSIYVPTALAITFPFNVALGIPLYHWMIGQVW
jgi:hypothetical protein